LERVVINMICPIDSRRYATDAMITIFSEEKILEYWLKVEAALAYAHYSVGNISKEAAEEIMRKANLQYVKLERVKELEKIIKHDLMAMVRALTEVCEGEGKKYVHLGATSNDIKDTALALQLKDAFRVIMKKLFSLEDILIELSQKYKTLVAVGRTHGQHANPITYGLKFIVYASEVDRHIERMIELKKRILVGKMTGATGTQAAFGDKGLKIQELVMKKLGLSVPLATTQILQRDRHAEFLLTLALIATTLDKIAKEIRNLQRTEIGEVYEFFDIKKQVGSSAMPSKRNPIGCEQINGLARVIRHLAFSSLENIPLWHERDLTNSSSERIIVPHVTILTDYILERMTKILKKIVVDEDAVKRNLFLTNGLNMSESVVMALVKKGMGRQEAHELVREAAMEAVAKHITFKETLLKNKVIRQILSEQEIEEALNPYNYIGTTIEQIENAIKVLTNKRKKYIEQLDYV